MQDIIFKSSSNLEHNDIDKLFELILNKILMASRTPKYQINFIFKNRLSIDLIWTNEFFTAMLKASETKHILSALKIIIFKNGSMIKFFPDEVRDRLDEGDENILICLE